MRQREAVRSGAEEGGEQSRQGYCSAALSLLPFRLQLAENTRRRRVLIANFEPNRFFNFWSDVSK